MFISAEVVGFIYSIALIWEEPSRPIMLVDAKDWAAVPTSVYESLLIRTIVPEYRKAGRATFDDRSQIDERM